MKFWDREKEKKWMKHYLQTEPNAILFVYGPKSSGKTTLLMKVLEEMTPNDFKVYWYDLRGKVITGYEDVLRVFFRERGWSKRMIEGISKILKFEVNFFEVDGSELAKVMSREMDAFEVMESRLGMDKNSGKRPVIVFDELQKLKEVYLNGGSQKSLIKELFSFFVRLTKVLHLAHVIVMTSDTFFIEQVYTDSTLKNTSRYYLVDFFDDETAIDILIQEGLKEDIAKKVISYIGGVPWMMEEIIKSKEEYGETVQQLFKESKSRMEIFLLERDDPKAYEKILLDMLSGDFKLSKENIKEVKELVEAEILFYDPVSGEVRFHTRLDEIAAREVAKD